VTTTASPTISGGHALAMRTVVERYRRPATALAARICGATLAEDVVQDAFLSIWRSSQTYSPQRGSISAWVLGIVRNRAIDALRRDARHTNRRDSDDTVDFLPDPEETDAVVDVPAASRWYQEILGAASGHGGDEVVFAEHD
jgi:RNA polymerase sigma factor (sigma-70 family)